VRISIVIPLYNKAPYVGRALDSIAAQTFSDFEVIVVDDGSTDEGGRIVESFGDARFRLITQPNAGPGRARNRGISEAKGDLLAFLDADDEWLPDYLEESLRLMESYGPEVASLSSGYIEYPAGVSREEMWQERGITNGAYRLDPETPPMLAVYMLAYMSPCSTVARADVLRKWGGFYEREKCLYAEDAFLWLKVLLNETVAFNLRPLVRFHVEASGLSKNLKGARPVEPFLVDASEIEAACPPRLRGLLERILALRAHKTACVLGYWGHWREARVLMKRFSAPGAWRLPYYAPAKVCGTPLGATLGKAWRRLQRLRPQTTA
jgi:glycosyltransferase involved in cell wall biosynthesis